MNTHSIQMGADFKLVGFDQFKQEGLILSNLMGLKRCNRLEFEAVGNYGDFATIKGSAWK